MCKIVQIAGNKRLQNYLDSIIIKWKNQIEAFKSYYQSIDFFLRFFSKTGFHSLNKGHQMMMAIIFYLFIDLFYSSCIIESTCSPYLTMTVSF